jgi:hypothetical protein
MDNDQSEPTTSFFTTVYESLAVIGIVEGATPPGEEKHPLSIPPRAIAIPESNSFLNIFYTLF